jgi:hypothetical protein
VRATKSLHSFLLVVVVVITVVLFIFMNAPQPTGIKIHGKLSSCHGGRGRRTNTATRCVVESEAHAPISVVVPWGSDGDSVTIIEMKKSNFRRPLLRGGAVVAPANLRWSGHAVLSSLIVEVNG